jgi:hypothetical protein
VSYLKGNSDDSSKLSKSRKDREKLKDEIVHLKRDIDYWKKDSERWRDRYLKEKSEREHEIGKLKRNYEGKLSANDDEITRMNNTIRKLDAAKLQVESDNRNLISSLSISNREHTSTKTEFEVYRKRAEGRERAQQERCNTIERDNENLRDFINSKSRPQEPNHAEDFYIQAFDDLKNGISDFVAKHSKLNSKETLSPAMQTKILAALAEFGNMGQSTSAFLKSNLTSLYTNRQTRIPLLRHIVAIHLFDKIFVRFAYAVTTETSEYLKGLENQLFHQGIETSFYFLMLGHDYNQLLIIRQSIAQGVLSSSESFVPAARGDTIKTFSELLAILLPKSRPGELRDVFTRIFDKAVTLKREMTQEKAVYRCFMYPCGSAVSDANVDFGDDGHVGGTLLVCTFPGLMRLIMNDDKFEKAIVVKADGELAFPRPETPKAPKGDQGGQK